MGKHRNWALGSTPRTTTETDGILGIKSHRKDPETTVLRRIRLGPSASGKRTDATNPDARSASAIFHSEMHATSNLQRFRDLMWRPTEQGARVSLPVPRSHGSPYVDGAQER